MNEKAAELEAATTHYADPSGLLSENVSSAYDLAQLIAFASSDERISTIMQKEPAPSRRAAGPFTFRSTNHLLGREGLDVRAGKTGFISKSGYCLATLLRSPDHRAAGRCRRARRTLERRPLHEYRTCSTGWPRRHRRCLRRRSSPLTTNR
jgi:D-alanyl-D-alanine endopeptidase (penicillin-binding protein 7)